MGKHAKKTVFNSNWLLEEQFKNWCKECELDQFSAKCVLCNRNFSLSNMGRQALVSHMQGAKHQASCRIATSSCTIEGYLSKPVSLENPADSEKETVLQIDTPSIEKPTCTVVGEDPIPVLQNIQPQLRGIKRFMEHDNITRAEILWCLQAVVSHLPLSGAGSCSEIFKIMFPDSRIAQERALKRSKMAYMITYGLGPYFHRQLLDDISAECPFSISFDETLNKVSKKCQMDLFIRYWSKSRDEVVSMYLGSTFLSHTTAVDLIEGFKGELKFVDLNKLIQISMDGPNVNLKFYRDFQSEIVAENRNGLVDIGTCGLHTLHNAFKQAIKCTGWNLVPFLRAVYNLFKDVPARKADYVRFSKSQKFPLKFCAVRWLHNATIAERASEILPNLKAYVKGARDEKIEPRTASYQTVVAALQDPMLGAQLAFMQTLASEVEPFLTAYQADKPMAPFLYTDLAALMSTVMSRFVKDVLDRATSVGAVDTSNTQNLLNAKNIKIGHEARAAIRRAADITEKQILQFRQNCLGALQTFCKKMKERSPLAYKFTKYLTFCDPYVVHHSGKVAESCLSNLIQRFVSEGWINGISGDKIEREFKNLCSKPGMEDILKKFSRAERLDKFWRNVILDFHGSSELLSFLKMILVLSHGQANVERGFSVNRECLIDNLSETSLVAQRQVWEGVHGAGGVAKISISRSMMHYARNSRAFYHQELELRKEKEYERKQEVEKRKAKEKICQLQEKRRGITAEMIHLDDEIRALTSKTH